MFTGIVESFGIIESVTRDGSNAIFWVSSSISHEFRVDQSVSHNGVCLTVDALEPGRHRVTAIAETLEKTDLGYWIAGSYVNLERSMKMNGRLDGHIVQGHVDSTAICTSVRDHSGSWVYRFQFPPHFGNLIIEKGSICLNGISLTIFDISTDSFSVAVIPYTYNNTNLRSLKVNSKVNLEFDMVGKYINRIHQLTATL
jgi:riboflavin synthase